MMRNFKVHHKSSDLFSMSRKFWKTAPPRYLSNTRLIFPASVKSLSFQQSLTCGGDFFDDFLAAGLWYFDVCAGIDQVCLGGEAVAHY